ncbi:hypothetical protein PV703_33220, partial [Streptomyces sp. ME01-24h]|nr:hypothetical protein [Streptomyces sp. ME01-24h]
PCPRRVTARRYTTHPNRKECPMGAESEAWAAQRDASWYHQPDVHTTKAIHMSGRAVSEGVMSRCGRSLLNSAATWRPEDVPAGLRCGSNGCRQAWPR